MEMLSDPYPDAGRFFGGKRAPHLFFADQLYNDCPLNEACTGAFEKLSEMLPFFPMGAEDMYWVRQWPGDALNTTFDQWKSTAEGYFAVDGAVPLPQGWSFNARYSHRIVLPRATGPGQRIRAFVNSYAPAGTCGAAAQVAQAIAMACKLSQEDVVPPSASPPPISSVGDIPMLSAWVDGLADRAAWVVSRIYLEGVPDRTIADLQSGKVGSGNKEGEHGRIVVEMGSALRDVRDNWTSVQTNLGLLAGAIRLANARLVAAKIDKDAKLASYAVQSLQIEAEQVTSKWGAIASWMPSMGLGMGKSGGFGANWNPLGAAMTTIGSLAANAKRDQQLAAIETLKGKAGEAEANQVLQALIELHQSAMTLHQNIESSLKGAQNAAAKALSLGSELRQAEATARYEVAKGLGKDYYVDENDKVVEIPVNTVLRREYDITKLRYDAALRQAKYLTYLAQLAIEQRIGARLSTFAKPVGALEPPAQWAPALCRLHGIDYQKLRSYYDHDAGDAGKTPSAAEEKAAIAEFADQYIGDHVAKLEQFVEYYNVQFPSHDGDDTVILSLRDDLLSTSGPCVRASPNELYYSGHLDQSDAVSEKGNLVIRGWRTSGCDTKADRCLRTMSGSTLPPPGASEPPGANAPPDSQVGGGVSWLLETDQCWGACGAAGAAGSAGAGGGGGSAGAAGAGGSGGTGGSQADAGPGTIEPPYRTVHQSVVLAAGDYVLSWYDQAREQDGNVLPASQTERPSTLQVGVYDEAWSPVQKTLVLPYQIPADPVPGTCPDGGPCDARAPWSARRRLAVRIDTSGTYHVAFNVSMLGEGRGSVAIANVQLEKVAAPGAQPGPYYGTTSSRQYLSSECKGRTPADVQGSFEYKCETSAGCFYELTKPILVDTGPQNKQGCNPRAMALGLGTIAGKLARGNFNYRHITAAVNLVGTGVHDCQLTGTGSCYGSGFSEYTLAHDAYDTGIIGWDGNVQKFNFGSASIHHGKALSAERFITMPLGSADQGLLSQPGIEKPELRGRPLEGSYRLRIWDSPALVWNKLEDVQIILKYRYWSVIQPQATGH
jgi:hypothetical protein